MLSLIHIFIQSKLADKQDKCQLADRQLAGLKDEMKMCIRDRLIGVKTYRVQCGFLVIQDSQDWELSF